MKAYLSLIKIGSQSKLKILFFFRARAKVWLPGLNNIYAEKICSKWKRFPKDTTSSAFLKPYHDDVRSPSDLINVRGQFRESGSRWDFERCCSLAK